MNISEVLVRYIGQAYDTGDRRKKDLFEENHRALWAALYQN